MNFTLMMNLKRSCQIFLTGHIFLTSHRWQYLRISPVRMNLIPNQQERIVARIDRNPLARRVPTWVSERLNEGS